MIAAGLAPNRTENGLAPLDFTRRLFCLDKRNRPKRPAGACAGGVKLDAFDMHPYTTGGPDRKARFAGNVQMGNLGQLKKVLKAADRANRIDGDRQADAALDHRDVVGLEAAGSGRRADEDPDALDS